MSSIAVGTYRRRLSFRGQPGNGAVKVSVAFIILLALAVVAAPLFAPYEPNTGDLSNTLAGSSPAHWLGTDANGRDILSRLIYGSRSSLLGPAVVVALSTAIGVPMGLLAGYRGGLADGVVGRTWDAILSFPALLLVIVVVAVVGAGFWTAVLAISLVYIPLIGRLTRSAVIVERGKPYLDACYVQGFRGTRIVAWHVLPNILPAVIAQATLNFGYALLDLAGLAFLGLGAQPPTADWGQMLSTGRNSLVLGSYLEVCAAALAIILTVLAFNLVGDALAAKAERKQ